MAGWAGSKPAGTPRPRWGRFGGRSPSATSGNSTPWLLGSWPASRSGTVAESGPVLVDVDDTIVGCTATPTGCLFQLHPGPRPEHSAGDGRHGGSAPVAAQRLRRGSCGSPRGAKQLVADAVKTVTQLTPGRPMLLRADSIKINPQANRWIEVKQKSSQRLASGSQPWGRSRQDRRHG